MVPENQSEKIRNIVYVCPVDHSGTSVFVKGWISPTSKSLSVPLIFIHDLEESPDEYVSCAEKLADQGFNVYIFELRAANKRSKGSSTLDLESYSNDLLQVVAWIKYKEGGHKPVVIGQGFGALISLYFVQEHSKYISSLVFASPLFSPHESITPFKRFFIKTMAQFLPSLPTPLFLSFMYTDIIKKDSRKRRGRLPISFIQGLLNSISQSHKLFLRINIPTLILCPSIDAVSRYHILKRLLSKHQHEEKLSLVHLDVGSHKVFTQGEDILEGVLGILLPWLKVHGRSQ